MLDGESVNSPNPEFNPIPFILGYIFILIYLIILLKS